MQFYYRIVTLFSNICLLSRTFWRWGIGVLGSGQRTSRRVPSCGPGRIPSWGPCRRPSCGPDRRPSWGPGVRPSFGTWILSYQYPYPVCSVRTLRTCGTGAGAPPDHQYSSLPDRSLTHSLIHSLINSLIHSLIHSFIHLFRVATIPVYIQSLIYLFTPIFTHLFTCSRPYSPTYLLKYSLT